MKNLDTTAKFDFKKTTITVFSKQPSTQANFLLSDDGETSSLPCATVILTGIFTGSSC
ncbi:hypothetical protein [Hymenobacter cellulosilyticus]|uniref:Uncharacterized protein n=1 Tax=Hymenobacter cellulosilyticus TaxID=2932248 RepID=A0A8T9QEM2_9BACT|nr:hypothetical protein [Hymenobacter cellulosilyticus]UOQ73999.1 hypothetical protein MUN79_08945 [Hymenobacter cellulosilyticus]